MWPTKALATSATFVGLICHCTRLERQGCKLRSEEEQALKVITLQLDSAGYTMPSPRAKVNKAQLYRTKARAWWGNL